MRWRPFLFSISLLLALVAGAAAAILTRDHWSSWLPAGDKGTRAKEPHHDHEESHKVTLSLQAQRNLRLVLKPIQPETWRRTLTVPATVVDWPGRTESIVSAPLAGIVTGVLAEPGRSVRPGEPLFQLRLVSEPLHHSQLEVFKTTRELELLLRQRERLAQTVTAGGTAANKLVELDQQRDRLQVHLQAYEQDLQARRLTPEQINDIRQGKFLTAVVVRAPSPGDSTLLSASEPQENGAETKRPSDYMVREVKVQVGAHVQAGQALAALSDPRWLYLEGQAFRQELDSIHRAVRERWPVVPDLGDGRRWSAAPALHIAHLGPTTGPGQVVPFYVPLPTAAGGLRPGQRLLLRVPVEEHKDILVLPRDAVAREGPEAYVFVPNGKVFERVTVQVLHEDDRDVILANDGSLTPGTNVVQNEAATLLRVLRSKSGGDEGHHHHHH